MIRSSFPRGYLFLTFLGFLGFLSLTSVSYAQKKTVKYKKHTQLDFSGETVQGKIRAPEVFYIFQRKKHGRHKVIRTPSSLDHHLNDFITQLRKELPK